jgi:hypothetical protein
MEPNPLTHSSLRLLRGERVWYNTGRPNIRVLTGQIRALGYEVWVLHVDIAGFQRQEIPRAEWLYAVVINRVLLLIADPENSVSAASDQSSEFHSEGVDSDNVGPDTGEWGGPFAN